MFTKAFFLCLVVLALVSCGKAGPDLSRVDSSQLQWSIIKSPTTGKCYESVTHTSGFASVSYGFMGMAEVSCEYYKK